MEKGLKQANFLIIDTSLKYLVLGDNNSYTCKEDDPELKFSCPKEFLIIDHAFTTSKFRIPKDYDAFSISYGNFSTIIAGKNLVAFTANDCIMISENTGALEGVAAIPINARIEKIQTRIER